MLIEKLLFVFQGMLPLDQLSSFLPFLVPELFIFLLSLVITFFCSFSACCEDILCDLYRHTNETNNHQETKHQNYEEPILLVLSIGLVGIC